VNLINIRIKRIAIHQVFQRDEDGNRVAPRRGVELIKFNATAMEEFKNRFISAIGQQSKAVNMSIVEQDKSKVPSIIDSVECTTDDEFLDLSVEIANKLTDAQAHRSIPGGIIVVFDGLYGATPKHFVGIMKAEIHSAYQKTQDTMTKEIGLEFIEEVLLTPAAKLYKTAAFFHEEDSDGDVVFEDSDLNKHWKVLISDSQISQTEGKAAAKYFYSTFLGCGYPATSARTTKRFYDKTAIFINDMDIPEEERSAIHTALNVYLRHEKSETVNPTEFASRHFDADTRDSYTAFLEDNELPLTSFTKDTEYISKKLKTRKLSFGQNVKITAPASNFDELINIESISEHDGQAVNWTRITVKDRIVAQE